MNKSDITRDYFMLEGPLAFQGYDWWWHSFCAYHKETNEPKSFFIEYFLCNPALAKDQPVIVWNDENKQKQGIKPSYMMVKVGYWGKEHAQIHRFFPWKDVHIEKNKPLNLVADDCLCSETRIKGSVKVSKHEALTHQEWMSDAGELSWDLKVNKQIAYHVGYGASRLFRKLNAFEMFWHAEGMKTLYEGTIILNGQEYVVKQDNCFGYADKNWGKDFTSPWVWLSSCHLYSEKKQCYLKNSVFEIGGGRPKVFGIALNRKLLGACYYEGEDFEFNFSKFYTGSKTHFNCYETPEQLIFEVEQSTFKAKMIVKITCDKNEMLWINYEAPNGTKRHQRLWNGGTGKGIVELYRRKGFKYQLIDRMKVDHVGCEYGVYEDAK